MEVSIPTNTIRPRTMFFAGLRERQPAEVAAGEAKAVHDLLRSCRAPVLVQAFVKGVSRRSPAAQLSVNGFPPCLQPRAILPVSITYPWE